MKKIITEGQLIYYIKKSLQENNFMLGRLIGLGQLNGVGDTNNLNRRTGLWEFYDRKKRLRYIVNYKNGLKNGLYEAYDPNGQIMIKGSYKDNQKDGVWEVYIKNRLDYIANFKDDEMNGDYIKYHPNGGVRSIGKYKNNKRDGYWDFYYSNGDKRSETLFNAGKVIKEKLFDKTKSEKPVKSPRKTYNKSTEAKLQFGKDIQTDKDYIDFKRGRNTDVDGFKTSLGTPRSDRYDPYLDDDDTY